MNSIIYWTIEEFVDDVHPGWYRYYSEIRRQMNFGIFILIDARENKLHVIREHKRQLLCSIEYDIHYVLDAVSFLINTIEDMKRDSLAIDNVLLLETVSKYEPRRH